MPNILKQSKKINILNHLVEGCGIRNTERLCDVHRDTVLKVLLSVSKKCKTFMNKRFRNLKINNLQADEIWTYVLKKDSELSPIEKSLSSIGSQYVYVAMDTKTKLVPSFFTGKRTKKTTFKFIQDLKNKINCDGRVQLTTDGYNEYVDAIINIFGHSLDYAQTIKHQGKKDKKTGKYTYTIKKPVIISGKPNKKKISTSYIERQNLTMRLGIERLTRKTLCFSKSLKYLKAAIYLHYFHYNFIRNHRTIKMTPAMAAEISGHILSWDNFV